MHRPSRSLTGREWGCLAGGVAALAVLTAVFRLVIGVTNPTVVALSFLLVVLFVAAGSTLRVAVATSILAVVVINYFFLPPVGRLSIQDPGNWVALFVFLVVSVVATRLSLTARQRASEAADRRDEMGRLFDLSRDVLLTPDSRDALDVLARFVARRFGLEYAAIAIPAAEGWQIHESAPGVVIDRADLDLAFAASKSVLEFDADSRTYGGHREVQAADGRVVVLTRIRAGTRPVALLATAGRRVEPGTLDGIAGLAAIALERAALLDERRDAEQVRQRAELKSALLSSLSHDLQTPLTAITVAADNLRAGWQDESHRREQVAIVADEVGRLNRLFQNLVDMARIETGAIDASRERVHVADLIEAATQQAERTLRDHPLDISVSDDDVVQVDPRLTSAALAHILENAGHYSPPGLPITITADVDSAGLTVHVRDRGPGLDATDLDRLFERFYRGTDARRQRFGTGMGLAITRGLLAVQQGRVWAENHPDGGALFTMVVPHPQDDADRPGSPAPEVPS